MGTVNYSRKSSEIDNVKFRRSLCFVKSLKAVERIRSGDASSVRSGLSLTSKHLDQMVRAVLMIDVKFDMAVFRGN